MTKYRNMPGLAALAGLVALAGSASANAPAPPEGVWLDHTGRGAVEIRRCGATLCGHLVWLKDQVNQNLCGTKIIGDVKPIGGGRWDNGWIYSPERESRFDVELTPLKSGKLRVLGYAGVKFLSETMIWQPAPADIQRCDTTKSAAISPGKTPAPVPDTKEPALTPPKPAPSRPAADRRAELKPAPKTMPEQQAQPGKQAAEPSRAAENRVPRKSGKSETCRLNLPYVSLEFPCPD